MDKALRLLDKINDEIKDYTKLTMTQIQQEYGRARRDLREAQRHSTELRIKWLEGKLRIFKLTGATKEEKEI
jgi:hypothetical protein